MNTKYIFSLLVMLLFSVYTIGQTRKGCIISIENGMANVDLTNAQVKAGDCLDVIVKGGYMTDPVTGRRVRKGDEVIGTLEVGTAYSEYSVARPYDASLLSRLKAGMIVRISAKVVTDSAPQEHVSPPEKPVSSRNEMMVNSFVSDGSTAGSTVIPEARDFSGSIEASEKASIVIAPAQVNDVVHNGHFGGYVADVLMEQMLMCDKVRLLDRSVLNAQIDEMNLAGDVLDPATTIQRGKGIGARYILQTTMQKPDVANVRTGIPLASVMGAVQGLTGVNIGAAYGSNMNIATLKASVSLSVRVVDLQTGEIVFMCSGNGKAQGKSQLSMEYGALGGGELNGGAEGFKQTVTGKAIQQAFVKIGRNLKDFFNGKTDRKVVGSVSGGASYGDKMYAKGYKLYMGTQRLNKHDIPSAFSEQSSLYFQYKQAKKKKTLSWLIGIGIPIILDGVLAVECSDSEDNGIPYFIAIGVGTIGCFTWGIMMNKSGRKKVRQIVDSYNSSSVQYSYYNVSAPQCFLSVTPTGIRFTF